MFLTSKDAKRRQKAPKDAKRCKETQNFCCFDKAWGPGLLRVGFIGFDFIGVDKAWGVPDFILDFIFNSKKV